MLTRAAVLGATFVGATEEATAVAATNCTIMIRSIPADVAVCFATALGAELPSCAFAGREFIWLVTECLSSSLPPFWVGNKITEVCQLLLWKIEAS